MNIATSNYNHEELKEHFHNSIRDSLNYLSELTESNIEIPEIKDFTWKIIASYYLATIYAENDNKEQTINYLSAIINFEKNRKKIKTESLDYNCIDNFSLHLLYSILERDDKGVRVGYFNANFENEHRKIAEALTILKDFDRSSYNEIECFIDTIYLTGPTDSYYIRSGCNFYMWGLVLLYANDKNTVPYYIEHIVHECAHHALNIINADDPLVINNVEERYDAPLRDDTRPMIGLYHAYFVLSRIYQSLNIISKKCEYEYHEEIVERKKIVLQKALSTGDIIRSNAKFTNIGKKLFDNVEKILKRY